MRRRRDVVARRSTLDTRRSTLDACCLTLDGAGSWLSSLPPLSSSSGISYNVLIPLFLFTACSIYSALGQTASRRPADSGFVTIASNVTLYAAGYCPPRENRSAPPLVSIWRLPLPRIALNRRSLQTPPRRPQGTFARQAPVASATGLCLLCTRRRTSG